MAKLIAGKSSIHQT